MDQGYWDTIAEDYDGEIFDVRRNDRNRVIEKEVRRLSRIQSKQGTARRRQAVDFGCGTGKFLPLLAKHFESVHGYDLSPKLVRQTNRLCHKLGNVTVERADLAKPGRSLESGDFGLCVNVLITDSYSIRRQILETISANLETGAPLLLVVPSLESVFLTAYRLIDWNVRDGFPYPQAASDKNGVLAKDALTRLPEGIVEIDSVPTKHYLKEELEHLLPQHGLKVKRFHKVEYGWETEFEEPDAHLKAPYPWDWLVEAESC